MKINTSYPENSIRRIQDMESIQYSKRYQTWSLLQEIPNTPMDDLNLTMEEYIRLEEEEAHKRRKVFNWQTTTYGKIRVDDDLHNLSSVEAEFPAIVINDAVVPQDELQRKSQEEMQTAGFGVYWAESARQIPDKGDLRDYWIGISSAGDFLGTAPSYTLIRDPILSLCHRLIACSIDGKSQAPEKVTVTDLFYLRGMDVGSVNVPYLLARYLRLFAAGRKSGAHISGGQFVARLVEHFGLLTAEILGGLTFDDTWAWVAMGLERQPVVGAGAPAVAKDALIIDEGGQADLAPEQAPQQPPPPSLAAARTIPQRLGRLEEDVQGLRRDVGSLRGHVERSMTDQWRFSTWMMTCMTQLMDASGLTYQAFDGTFRGSSPVAFQRRTKQRTGEASTSAAQQDPQQPDP
ncbi:hypothetical protein Tco_0880216 [Tanacetum coccineum]